VARRLDEVAQVEGSHGVLLTFHDIPQRIENFGQHIQPLMACRSALLDAQQEVA